MTHCQPFGATKIIYDTSISCAAWSVVANAASVAPEIAHNLKSVDDAIRWGFAFEVGPFQLWDKLGVAQIAAKMEASGRSIAPWVKEMLAAGCNSFYRVEDDRVTGY